MNNTLQRLLDASRPYKEFTAVINEETFKLYARKASLATMSTIAESWDSTYSETLAKYDDTSVDTAPIFAALRRLDVDKLSKYIAEADKQDFTADTLQFLDKTDPKDLEVESEVERRIQERITELKLSGREELLKLAVDRRAHYYAIVKSNEATNRKMASLLIYNEDKTPLFESPDDATQLTYDDLTKLVEEASKAVADADAAPLT